MSVKPIGGNGTHGKKKEKNRIQAFLTAAAFCTALGTAAYLLLPLLNLFDTRILPGFPSMPEGGYSPWGLSGLFISLLILISFLVLQSFNRRGDGKDTDVLDTRARMILDVLINSIPDRVYVKDRESRFLLLNRALLRHLGVEREEEAIGKTDADFFSADLAKSYREDEAEVINRGRAVVNKEDVGVSGAGVSGEEEQYYLTTKLPLRDEEGKVIGLFGISRDITVRKKSEIMIQEKNRGLVDGASALAASVSQIQSTASELATSMEELRRSAEIASEHAEGVTRIARKAADASEEGEKATRDTVDFIMGMKRQIDTISESVGQLSGKSSSAESIVHTVKDLANQANLLAVNTSLEASKAGEKGRGIQIIAREIRNLAQRSRSATGRIQTILSDIRTAAEEVISRMEQGSKSIAEGMTRTVHAGETIGRLADSIREASESALQIASSSREQFVGVDQNLAAVRQLEEVAHKMGDLGNKMKTLSVRTGEVKDDE